MSENVTVVAVDGPAASGKSTVSRAAAKILGFNYVDTGAMYRSITWKALEDKVDVDDTIAVIALMHRIQIDFELVNGEVRMLIDGVYPGAKIRQPHVAEKVSTIAAIPEVRQVLVQHQRSLTKFGSLVMEGRDIGTVVFPDTPFKFYLEAKPDVRAQRRKRDLEAMQIQATQEGVAQSIQQRDKKDSGRSVSPLQIALGATVVDNSNLTADETAKIIVDHIRQQGLRRGSATEIRNSNSEIRKKPE
ncbi:MAG TPA: (d)CMP kinase [Verrucomicrobiae bacterium]|nr:(d)CMP kinase [Verrucomicrobiae bacterium]